MTKLEKAEQTALTAIPARISFAEVAFPPMFAMAITAKEVIIAPMKAVIPTEFPPRKLPIPSMMASVAPRDAPDDTQHIRVCQRVLHDSLHHHAAHGKSHSNCQSQKDSRQPDQPHNIMNCAFRIGGQTFYMKQFISDNAVYILQ